jgi:porin
MYGYADPTISPITQNFGFGVTLTAPFLTRPNDIVGVGIQVAQLSNEISTTADYEIDYELFYRIQITPWFYVKPDIQYISNPAGQGTPDALAISLRAQIDF